MRVEGVAEEMWEWKSVSVSSSVICDIVVNVAVRISLVVWPFFSRGIKGRRRIRCGLWKDSDIVDGILTVGEMI